jgi:transcription elongation GreA/GreB family factor
VFGDGAELIDAGLAVNVGVRVKVRYAIVRSEGHSAPMTQVLRVSDAPPRLDVVAPDSILGMQLMGRRAGDEVTVHLGYGITPRLVTILAVAPDLAAALG